MIIIKLFWNKICHTFDNMSNTKKNIVKSNKNGRLYIDTKDFLLQPKVKKIIKELLDSDLIEEINERNRKKIPA